MFMHGVRAPGLGFCSSCVTAARFVPKTNGMELGSALGLGVTHSTRGGQVALSHPDSCSPGQLLGALLGVPFPPGTKRSELSSYHMCVGMQ